MLFVLYTGKQMSCGLSVDGCHENPLLKWKQTPDSSVNSAPLLASIACADAVYYFSRNL